MIQMSSFFLRSLILFEKMLCSLCILNRAASFYLVKEILKDILTLYNVESFDVAPFDKFCHHPNNFCLDGQLVFFEHFLKAIQDVVTG